MNSSHIQKLAKDSARRVDNKGRNYNRNKLEMSLDYALEVQKIQSIPNIPDDKAFFLPIIDIVGV